MTRYVRYHRCYMLAKSGTKPIPYPSKPYPISQEESEKERLENKKQTDS